MTSEDSNQLNEENPIYSTGKNITIFNSFEEQKEHHLQKMASQSHKENLIRLEELRKIFLKDYLLPDGSWMPMKKVFKLREPFK